MAINTLFQNIADAIREKTGSAGSLTPAQMPGAIRAINTGGLTIDQLGGVDSVSSGTVIHLTHSLDDYDIIVIYANRSTGGGAYVYQEFNFILASVLEVSRRIGQYDDASYIWFTITDMNTLTYAMGATGIKFYVYGLKWG